MASSRMIQRPCPRCGASMMIEIITHGIAESSAPTNITIGSANCPNQFSPDHGAISDDEIAALLD